MTNRISRWSKLYKAIVSNKNLEAQHACKRWVNPIKKFYSKFSAANVRYASFHQLKLVFLFNNQKLYQLSGCKDSILTIENYHHFLIK